MFFFFFGSGTIISNTCTSLGRLPSVTSAGHIIFVFIALLKGVRAYALPNEEAALACLRGHEGGTLIIGLIHLPSRMFRE